MALSFPPPSKSVPADRLSHPPWPPELAGSSPLVRQARDAVQRAAVLGRALVVAEEGLDAEAVARTIHQCGAPGAPFVAIDCRQGDAGALEAALFGPTGRERRERGNAPAAVAAGCRLLEAAGGTLYLAHVVDLPAAVQERLARIFRDGEVRVGRAGKRVKLEARVVAGCGTSVETEVAQGGFRADLYRRLAAVRIEVPPLRLRREDIPAVARAVLAEGAAQEPAPRVLTKAAAALVAALPWPGNVRELRDVLARAAAVAPPGPLRVEDVLGQLGEWPRLRAMGASLREARRQFEREFIAAVLREHGWRIGDAARALGMQRTNLYRKIRQLSMPSPRTRTR